MSHKVMRSAAIRAIEEQHERKVAAWAARYWKMDHERDMRFGAYLRKVFGVP